MAFNIVVLVVITAFWAVVGLVLPLLLPKGFDRGVVQTCLILTAVCCYMMFVLLLMLSPASRLTAHSFLTGGSSRIWLS